MAQQEQDEKEKERQRRDKASLLMQQRTPALQGKIRRMLKVTKSANKAVLADAIDENNTALTMLGPEQPDEDDYGYTSIEASKLYRSIMDKYGAIPEEKKFSDGSKKERSRSELVSTKDRVREAILREREEEALSRKRGTLSVSSTSTRTSDEPRHRSRKNLYDPAAEREEEERRKREEDEERRRKAKLKRPAPPVMNFQKLLELAQKKQFEPVEIEVPQAKKTKEPERLLTRKEKAELEAKNAYMADRERRKQEALNPQKRRADDSRIDQKPVNKMAPNGRIPKLNSSATPQATSRPSQVHEKKKPEVHSSASKSSTSISKPSSSKYDDRKSITNGATSSRAPLSSSSSSHTNHHKSQQKLPSSGSKTTSTHSPSTSKLAPAKSSLSGLSNGKNCRDANRNEVRPREYPPKDVKREPVRDNKAKPVSSKDIKSQGIPPKDLNKMREFPPKDIKARQPVAKDVKTRELQTRDLKSSTSKTREFPPKDLNKTREFPPKDLIKTREFPPKDIKTREFPPKDIKTREFPPRDIKTREFPPKDIKTRQFPPRDIDRFGRQRDSTRKPMQKRRCNGSDSEYDSEMDDFIDDDEADGDYSKYIKEIFGYDKSKYQNLDDDIDNMESTFAQQMREEQISRKIGLMEDLEDMRLEAAEMKRKQTRKKRRALSDDDDD